MWNNIVLRFYLIQSAFTCFSWIQLQQLTKCAKYVLSQLFHDGDPYHRETRPLICSRNQWTGSYMIGTSVMKELKV